MRKVIPRAAAITALLILLPVAVASAGPYATTMVYQASGTPSPPANGDSPFASCDISGFLLPGEINWLNSELEPWVAVNPTDSSNLIGVYQQDRYTLGGARGLGAAVSHNGGQTWARRSRTSRLARAERRRLPARLGSVGHVLPERQRVLHQPFAELRRGRLADRQRGPRQQIHRRRR